MHGGDRYYLEKIYGIKKEDILDFSININPLGAPECIRELIIENLSIIETYPDPECRELKSYISKYCGVSKSSIIIGNGALEVLMNAFEVFRFKKVLIPAPTFTEYSKMFGETNVPTIIKFIEMKETEDFCLNIDRMITAMTEDVDGIVLCNPNNPTSTLLEREKLQKILFYAYQKNIKVIVDETFIELTEAGLNNSVADMLDDYENLFIVRAMTKSLSIPGLRLGYGLGQKEMINKMWQKKLTWSVNSLACCLGKALFETEHFKKTHEWLKSEIPYMFSEMSNIPKLKVYRPHTNFMLVQVQDCFMKAPELKYLLATRGILIRDASDFDYLDEKYFRVAIKLREQNNRLLKELNDIFR